MTEEFETYADWYVWAKRNLSSDARVCHGAAAAATSAAQAGGDRHAAVAAARQAVATGGHLAVEAGDIRRRTYAEWFDWARREMGGQRTQQAAAAGAALAALDAGRGANAAMVAARTSHGPAGASIQDRAPIAPTQPAAPALPIPDQPWALPGYPVPPPPSYPGYAGFWRRLAAFGIDIVALLAATTALAFLLGTVAGLSISLSGSSLDPASAASQLVLPLQLVSLALAWLYFTILESSPLQGTLGKRALGIKVTDSAGTRVSWARSNARNWSKVLSALLLGIGFLMIGFTDRRQGLHDMIAAALVVRR